MGVSSHPRYTVNVVLFHMSSTHTDTDYELKPVMSPSQNPHTLYFPPLRAPHREKSLRAFCLEEALRYSRRACKVPGSRKCSCRNLVSQAGIGGASIETQSR